MGVKAITYYFRQKNESGFGVWGLGFGVWGLGFGVWGLGPNLFSFSKRGSVRETKRLPFESSFA
jgi:hypothetical protein